MITAANASVLYKDLEEAIRNSQWSLRTLRNLEPVRLPPASGASGSDIVMCAAGFSAVFKMQNTRTGNRLALKCFLNLKGDRQERYNAITAYLSGITRPWLMTVSYFGDELSVNPMDQSGEVVCPVLSMPWIEGPTLGKTVEQLTWAGDQGALRQLAQSWAAIAQDMLSLDFAHGDLKPDNILVTNNRELVLVDYDSMFVPALKGRPAADKGGPAFQHPERQKDQSSIFDKTIDHFPMLVIGICLRALAVKPGLFANRLDVDQFLFRSEDFTAPHQSQVFRDLMSQGDTWLTNATHSLIAACKSRTTAISDIRDQMRLLGLAEAPKPSPKPTPPPPTPQPTIAKAAMGRPQSRPPYTPAPPASVAPGAAISTAHQSHTSAAYRSALAQLGAFAGVSAGALAGFAVGFIPCWVISGVISYIWRGNTGWESFWWLWIGSSVVGILMLWQSGRSWVASRSQDRAEVIAKGALIGGISLVLVAIFVFHLIGQSSFVPISNDNSATALSFTSVEFAQRMQDGQPIGPSGQFAAPASPVLYATYVNGRSDTDTVGMTVWNGTNQISHCNDLTIEYQNGNYFCPVSTTPLDVGSYNVELIVNGQVLGSYSFTVVSPSSQDTASGQTSFDCGRVHKWAEITVCNTPMLATQDRQMASLYGGLISNAAQADREALRTAQRQWIAARDQCEFASDPTSCLISIYASRIGALSGGVTSAETQNPSETNQEAPAVPSPPVDVQAAPAVPNVNCGFTPSWVFVVFCHNPELAALNMHVVHLQSIFDEAYGMGDALESMRWQSQVTNDCKEVQSPEDCLRSALEARSQLLQTKIPEALASNTQSLAWFKDDARKRWEQHNW